MVLGGFRQFGTLAAMTAIAVVTVARVKVYLCIRRIQMMPLDLCIYVQNSLLFCSVALELFQN